MRRQSVILGVAIVILAVTLWRITLPSPLRELRLTQLTFDPGVTTSPALSSDGKMLAYVSDRDGGTNLDLYVQQIPGGGPERLTETAEDESEPNFSPDGARLIFSKGGSIHEISVKGGEARLIAEGGHPRYSPDGRWIAFEKGSDAAAPAVYVLPSSGGAARVFHGEFGAVHALCWSPDSRSLLFWGHRSGAEDDWWVAPLEGGDTQGTGLRDRMEKAHLGSGPFDDARWTAEGLLFSARTGVVRNLYRCPLDEHGKASGDIVRLTSGTELLGDPAGGPRGRIVFSSSRQRYDIWGVPLDAGTGKASGDAYRITDSLAPTSNPDISPDGSKLLFGSSRNGFTQVWEKDLKTGKERVAATGPEGASYGRFARGSGDILSMRSAANYSDAYLGDRKIASGVRVWDADSRTENVLVGGTGIDKLDLKTGARAPVLQAPPHTTLSQASFSPDDRWILFAAETGPQSSRIYVAPSAGGEWLAVTAEGRFGKPRFSPDGRFVYFTMDTANSRTIHAIRFEVSTGQTAGESFPVFASGTPRLSLLAVNPQALEIAVAHDRLVTILREVTTTIWMADPLLK